MIWHFIQMVCLYRHNNIKQNIVLLLFQTTFTTLVPILSSKMDTDERQNHWKFFCSLQESTPWLWGRICSLLLEGLENCEIKMQGMAQMRHAKRSERFDWVQALPGRRNNCQANGYPTFVWRSALDPSRSRYLFYFIHPIRYCPAFIIHIDVYNSISYILGWMVLHGIDSPRKTFANSSMGNHMIQIQHFSNHIWWFYSIIDS